MSKLRFAGILFLTTGIVLVIIGLIIGIPEFHRLKNPSSSISPQASATPTPTSRLVVNLPAPQSLINSPLLVRGRVYGPEIKISLQLTTSTGEILVETTSTIPNNSEAATDAQLFQTILTFDQPASTQRGEPPSSEGKLKIKLLSTDGLSVDEQEIPLVFK